MQLKHRYSIDWNTNTVYNETQIQHTLKTQYWEKEKERMWCMYNKENLDDVTRTWDITTTKSS